MAEELASRGGGVLVLTAFIVVICIIGFFYFTNVINTPFNESYYYKWGCTNYANDDAVATDCLDIQYPLYLKTQSEASHWRDAMIAIGLVSGIVYIESFKKYKRLRRS
jgi:hypothetical protein